MNRLFNLDSPIMVFLGKVGDLIWLNVLTMICCIPIVTVGASITALHYVSIKMVRNEEGYLTKNFFKSFRQNFFQATVLWVLMLFILAVAGADFYFLSMMEGTVVEVVKIGLYAVFLFFLCSSIYWFPLLSKFENSLRNIVKNSLLLSIMHFPKTIGILLIHGVFIALYYFFTFRIMPVILLMGISLPAYAASYLFSGIFKKLEPEVEEISQSV